MQSLETLEEIVFSPRGKKQLEKARLAIWMVRSECIKLEKRALDAEARYRETGIVRLVLDRITNRSARRRFAGS